jgi:hypothetical protein
MFLVCCWIPFTILHHYSYVSSPSQIFSATNLTLTGSITLTFNFIDLIPIFDFLLVLQINRLNPSQYFSYSFPLSALD